MPMRHTLSALMLVMAILPITGMSAKAYQYTGAVKTLESGVWQHWQEIKLEKGDDSVWTPCRQFTRQYRALTAQPLAFAVQDCVDLSEQLSGVNADQHNTLPVGTSLWVPYMPVDMQAADVAVLAREPFDPTSLEEALADVQATMLTEVDVVALVTNSATTLERALMQQIQMLRTDLSTEQSNSNQMLLARLVALEQAIED